MENGMKQLIIKKEGIMLLRKIESSRCILQTDHLKNRNLTAKNYRIERITWQKNKKYLNVGIYISNAKQNTVKQ